MAGKKTAGGSPKKGGPEDAEAAGHDDIATMPLAELERRVGRAEALLVQLEAELPNLVEMTSDERAHSMGKLRDGESDALRTVLDAADAFPGYFQALAARDHGKDPAVFETAPAREALSRREILARLSNRLAALDTKVGDTVLEFGAIGRGVGLAAYAIASVNAESDAKLRSKIAPARSHFATKRTRKPKNK